MISSICPHMHACIHYSIFLLARVSQPMYVIEKFGSNLLGWCLTAYLTCADSSGGDAPAQTSPEAIGNRSHPRPHPTRVLLLPESPQRGFVLPRMSPRLCPPLQPEEAWGCCVGSDHQLPAQHSYTAGDEEGRSAPPHQVRHVQWRGDEELLLRLV